MGRVYLCTDSSGRRVAVKVLDPGSTAGTVERFLREADLLASLSHPNIVRVHEAGQAAGLHFYVMDYIDAPTLETRLRAGPLAEPEVRSLGRDLLTAIEAIHAMGVVHRDVKPSNIFLVPGRALLGDFGIAHFEDAETLTSSGDLIGTAGYRAPEQLQAGPVTSRTDIYATGITCYEAVTGRRWRIVEKTAEADWDEVSTALRLALSTALAFRPDDRWPNAAAFRRALEEGWARRRRAARWVLGGCAASVALVAALWPGPPRHRIARAPADIMLVPFAPDSAPAARGGLSRVVLQRLQWFPQWTVDLRQSDEGGPGDQAINARAIVSGTLSDADPSSLDLAIRDSANRVVSRVTVTGDTTDLAGWGARIADTIVSRHFPRWLEQYRELASRQRGNTAAYREFFRGEDDFARDAWKDAERHYRRALEIDSTFLQAAWRLTVVRRWARVPFEVDLRRLYDEHQNDLPPLYRLLAEAQLAPDIRRRVDLYGTAVHDFPHSGYAALLHADELFHRGALIGIPLDSSAKLLEAGAGPGFDRTLALDHLLWAYIRLGRKDDAWRALQERLASERASIEGGGDVDVATFLRLAYVERFHPYVAPVLRWWALDVGTGVPASQLARVVRVATMFDLPQAQLALARTSLERDSSLATRITATEAVALALMMGGRPGEAMSRFDSAAALLGSPLARLQSLQWRVLPYALAWPTSGRRDDAAESALGRLAADSGIGNEAAWSLAIALMARGDTTGATRWEAIVRRDSATEDAAARRSALLGAVREASRGRFREALATSEPAIAFDSTGRIGGAFLRAATHLARGRWWLSLGEGQRADAEWLWYENSDFVGWPHGEAQAGEVDAVFSVAARRLRVLAAVDRGDRSAACPAVRRVAELWRGADTLFARWRSTADSIAGSCRT